MQGELVASATVAVQLAPIGISSALCDGVQVQCSTTHDHTAVTICHFLWLVHLWNIFTVAVSPAEYP